MPRLLGGQHLNLLLHLADGGALLGRLGLRLPQRVFQIGQRALLLLKLRGQGDGLLFGLGDLRAARFSSSSSASALRAAHWAICSFSCGQALLGALAAFDHEADLGFERPTSALASYSKPCAWFT
jgi:hypothetical protein